jgi:DNA-binding transcriptional regulator LsrR (DeoR family)
MAGKIKSMSQIKKLLLLYQQGKGRKIIARTLGISKNMAGRIYRSCRILLLTAKTRL